MVLGQFTQNHWILRVDFESLLRQLDGSLESLRCRLTPTRLKWIDGNRRPIVGLAQVAPDGKVPLAQLHRPLINLHGTIE